MASCKHLTFYIDKVRTWKYRQCTSKNFTFISEEIQELLKALIKKKIKKLSLNGQRVGQKSQMKL